jgi:hypothetical protein
LTPTTSSQANPGAAIKSNELHRLECYACEIQETLLFITEIITKQSPAVLILMAVNTQIFPVRTIRGIIPVIAVFMVYGQQMPVFVSKLPSTFGTDKSVDLK